MAISFEAVRHNSEVALNGYISWAQGFISAHNGLKSQERDVIIDHSGLAYYLSDYCGGHPQASFYGAVQRLIAEPTRR